MSNGNITSGRPTLEWGKKARKIEARNNKTTDRRVAIRDAKENG